MLKVAASDYDGTLFRDDIITARDAEAIRKWRAAGHKFGVVSGRDHGMLMPQLKHYGVEYDYLPAITAASSAMTRNASSGKPASIRLSSRPSANWNGSVSPSIFPFPRRTGPTSAMICRVPGSGGKRKNGIIPSYR